MWVTEGVPMLGTKELSVRHFIGKPQCAAGVLGREAPNGRFFFFVIRYVAPQL